MYVKVDDEGARLYSLNELYQDNPNTSFPAVPSIELLAGYGVHPCEVDPTPAYSEATHFVRLGALVERSGAWIQTWDVVELEEDVAASNVRAVRNAEIASCDWTQVSDAPVNKTAWAAYRAELRDIPEQAGFPFSVVWPTKPEL
jgi:hypothetical protein